MKLPIVACVCICFGIVSGKSFAGVQTYTDRSAWTTRVDTLDISEDFNGFTEDIFFDTAPFDVGPFTLVVECPSGCVAWGRNLIDVPPFVIPESTVDGTPGISCYDRILSDMTIHIIFTNPVTAFGFDIYGAGYALLGSILHPLHMIVETESGVGGASFEIRDATGEIPDSSSTFFGFVSTERVTSIVFDDDGFGDEYYIDNIVGAYDVWAPTEQTTWGRIKVLYR